MVTEYRTEQITPKCIIFTLIFFATVFISQAQTNRTDVKPLKIGDTVPDIAFKKMINYKDTTANLSDFAGKAIILDFWATYCVPCITAFPKLEKFQREFEEDLKIILLSSYDERGTRNFYRNKSNLILPTAFYNRKEDIISRLLPHKEIPHYVWIDRSGVVYAITDASSVTKKNIDNFLNEKSPQFRMKDDSLRRGNYSGAVLDSIVVSEVSGANKISVNPNIAFQSMLLRYDPRLTVVCLEGLEEYKNRYVSLQNYSVISMMRYALGCKSSDTWKLYLDLADTALKSLPTSTTTEERENWRKDYTYTYRIILDRQDSLRLHRIMLRDLEWTLGIRTYAKKITAPYLVLRTIGNTGSLMPKRTDTSFFSNSIYNITLQNRPIKDLISSIYRFRVGREFTLKQQLHLFIEDRTGINHNIDIDIKNINITNINDLNDELQKVGLELIMREREMEMVVITDK